MKTLLTILLFLSTFLGTAQKHLDTIFANEKMNVSLFFPNPIRQGITGTSNFTFTYNREREQYFGLLQATPGDDSNILVVTTNGQVYSYTLKYATKVPQMNYFISEDESIGNEKPKLDYTERDPDTIEKVQGKEKYFKWFSENLLKPKLSKIASKQNQGIRLRLLNVAYIKNEVYIAMEIKNKSGIDLDLDYINVYKTNENKGSKSSSQRLKQEVVFKYDLPRHIINNGAKHFVYVMPKFVLGDNERLLIELKELSGSRRVVLKTKL
ncbi:DUF4138 domain-containing protein [Gaetbulibacter sp. M235]|uniref:DUF4138 domain-containing protein n=1 Tax=Gaetbulibacter sp. M235 TaxID=3126510 RepID=UPI00374F1825